MVSGELGHELVVRDTTVPRLAAGGFDAGFATAWLAEGLLIYLSADEASTLLTGVTDLSAPGSQLAFEHGRIADDPVFGRAQTVPTMREYTALWKGGLGTDAPTWLADHGWRVRLHDAVRLAESCQRPAPAGARGGFLSATRGASG